MTDEYELARVLHRAYIDAVNQGDGDLRRIGYDKMPIEAQTMMLNMAENLVEEDKEVIELIQ